MTNFISSGDHMKKFFLLGVTILALAAGCKKDDSGPVTPTSTPSIAITPDSLRLTVQNGYSDSLIIRNTGTGELTVDSITVVFSAGSGRTLAVALTGSSFRVAASASHTVYLYVSQQDTTHLFDYAGEVSVYSNASNGSRKTIGYRLNYRGAAYSEIEPNDETPQALGALAGSDILVAGSVSTVSDVDKYSVFLGSSTNLHVELLWTGGSDLDFGIMNPNGIMLTYRSNGTDPEQCTLAGLTPGTYTIYVAANSASSSQAYSLRIGPR
jgi:hypothetical protein